ncbi:MAG: hypothetical protein V3U14_02405 [candidate division NC10 bacterium]
MGPHRKRKPLRRKDPKLDPAFKRKKAEADDRAATAAIKQPWWERKL